MIIDVSENLKTLANLTNKMGYKTYLVGGYVRNALLGLSSQDVDIASAMPINKLETLCKKAGYETEVVNKKLGTVQIRKDNEVYEYTAFRKEVYDQTGKHSPEEVTFIDDYKVDASRRDFTVNSIYYDIVEDKILDTFNGCEHIRKKMLKTVLEPEIVFTDDGLRILRLIRFAAELDFKPERHTLVKAKEYASKVADISGERILKEIKTAVNGGLKYQLKNDTHGNVVKYYNKLNLWQHMFKGNFVNFKVKQSGKLYKAYLKSDGSCRFIAFMCLVLNNYIKVKSAENNIAFSVSQILGATGLKESNKNIQEIYDAYVFVQNLIYGTEKELITNVNAIKFNNLTFETKNYLRFVNAKMVDKINTKVSEMKKQDVPFSEEELRITSTDLIEKVKVNNRCVSKIKNTLFEMCVKNMIVNDYDVLMEQAKFLNEKLEKILSGSKEKLVKNVNLTDDVVEVE